MVGRSIDARTDRHVWADGLTRSYRDVLKLQVDLAGEIAGQLRASVLPETERRLAAAPEVDSAAYALYAHGRRLRFQETRESVVRAVNVLQRSIAINSSYAPAWAVLSFCALLAPRIGGKLPEGLNSDSLARNAAVRALQLDSTSAEAHIQMGIVRQVLDRDYAAAGPHLKRAVELNPGLANAHRKFGLYLLRVGQTDAAERYALEAMRLNPASADPIILGNIELGRGNYEKDREHFRKTLALLPENRWPARDLGLVYAEMDSLEAALRTIRRAELPAGRRLTYSGLAYARAGRRVSARAALERLRRQFDAPHAEAQIHAALCILQ